MSSYSDLLYEVSDHIATITLNRPDRMNAISGPMLASLSRVLRDADADAEVRVIVLTGAGRGFCAGLDLKDLTAGTGIGAGDGAGLATARFDLAGSPPVVLHTTDKPVLCALNGAAAGYGMDLALGCDIRIASTQARLAAVFTRRGVVPETGGTWLPPPPRRLGTGRRDRLSGPHPKRPGVSGVGAGEPGGGAPGAGACHPRDGRRDRRQRPPGGAGHHAADGP